MRARFKPHLEKMQRARTSTGRDMLEGWCLDRNERVTGFPDEILAGLYRQLPKFVLNTYPDTDYFYDKLAKVLGLRSANIFKEFPNSVFLASVMPWLAHMRLLSVHTCHEIPILCS